VGINDGLMAIFFLLVGLEIKREARKGELAGPNRAALLVVAAIGGMAAPALVFWFFNAGHPVRMEGWAIPTATDIAFALGVLPLLGERVPASLKIFLLALAIVDDLGAIVLVPEGRTDTGYRLYKESDVRRLAFMKQAQLCGLSLEVIRELLQPVEGPDPRASAAYRAAMAAKAPLERKIEALRKMKDALAAFAARCDAGEAQGVLAGEHSADDALEEVPDTVPWPEAVSLTAAARKQPLHAF
jgi:DNA-binding transcriptional MerR regulator